MFDLDPDKAGWWVAFCAFVLQGTTFAAVRTEKAKQRRDDHIRELARQEDARKFDGENGVHAQLAAIKTSVAGVKEAVVRVDEKLDQILLSGQIEIVRPDDERRADRPRNSLENRS